MPVLRPPLRLPAELGSPASKLAEALVQIVAAIVLAAVVFIAANHYVTRFGLLWWVAHTLVFALVLAFVWLLASMLFAPSGPPASNVGPPANQAASQLER